MLWTLTSRAMHRAIESDNTTKYKTVTSLGLVWKKDCQKHIATKKRCVGALCCDLSDDMCQTLEGVFIAVINTLCHQCFDPKLPSPSVSVYVVLYFHLSLMFVNALGSFCSTNDIFRADPTLAI